ncbi:MAG: DNA polymerase III subunit alpha, partial [Verrucomicrobia bacterium]|nr:DNA polymerase III subunit alpha [Verrucomicrobiota bacterium]
MSKFIHLHVHSQYSILDASASLSGLVQKAASDGMPALALTDHGNLFGAVDFYKLCKEHKVKPIIGCEMYVAPTSRLEKKKMGSRVAHHLTLIAKDKTGYHNLSKLSSLGYTEGFYYYPRIDFDLLKAHKEGLICLSGCLESAVAQAALNSPQETLEEVVMQYKELFGEDFYFEIQRHTSINEELELDGMFNESWLYSHYQEHIQKQERLIQKLVPLSKTHNIPLVATNNVHYLERSDWKAHEILLNIQSGEPVEEWQRDAMGNPKFRTPNPKRSTFASHELYFKTADEMASLFQDIPEACQNTVAIADKCTLELDLKTKHYPVFVPEGNKDIPVEEYLWNLCREGIPKRYTAHNLARVQEKYPGRNPLEVVEERLNYEMSIICPKGMCDYLLIVWDFIHWAKKNGIPMGPGRGSGAGSIILYLTEITDIEPLQFNLFFERFINPERVSYPDIDVDICMDRRGEVINYTIDRFGKDNVAQIITFGSMKAKMVIKDVGRALNIPLAKVNSIAKLVPDDLNITLEKALEKDPDLKNAYDSDEETHSIIDIGRKLEGAVRNTGIHAAGMIISGQPLLEHIPLCVAKDSSMLVTQYSMKPVEMVGMLKIDFLGLKTLTSIKLCVEAIAQKTGNLIDWINLPLDDIPTFSLLNCGKTLGVFQLESGGMQELAKQLHLDKFEEIIAVVALYRPGPMDMIPSFIARKHGTEQIESDHPWMDEILAETYGIMVYQEQVMNIAQKLANYSLGEGDVLRRAMGKKDKNEMMKQREKFLGGAE